ncbi:MAG TPA: YbaN family protein [Bacteroidales bacterium]|nr:YbaN family protein [Bacteroidales bacterium]
MKPAATPHFGKNLSPWVRIACIIAGTLFFGLAMIGIPLPLLPTTPFLLLSAWFYALSSKRFYTWLVNHRYFGKIIRNYHEKGGVEKKVKIFAIALLWTTIALSATFAVDQWWIRILLLIIAMGVTIHIKMLKTV